MRKDIDGFGSLKRPIPPMCSILIHLNGSDAEPILNCGVSLEGIYIDNPKETNIPKLFIQKKIEGIVSVYDFINHYMY